MVDVQGRMVVLPITVLDESEDEIGAALEAAAAGG
jgi:hypothetical protein